MKRTSRKGFTLIELIVTIVILGILAALAVPAFQAVIERSRENAVVQAANSGARELHALAAFDADFDATAIADWQVVRDEAVAAGDLDADADNDGVEDNYTLAAVAAVAAGPGPDGISGNADDVEAQDAYVNMTVTLNGYTAVANLGQTVGAFDASATTVS